MRGLKEGDYVKNMSVLKKQKKIHYLLLLSLFFVVLLGYGYALYTEDVQKTEGVPSAIHAQLQSFLLPLEDVNVSLPTQPSENMRLNWYATITRVSPIFSLEGADLPKLQEASDLAKESRTRFANLSWRSDEDAQRLTESLYPAAFIDSLPELETLRRDLVVQPDMQKVTSYNSMLNHAIDEYIQAVQAQKQLLAEHEIQAERIQYYFPAGYSTRASLYNMLENLERGAQFLKQESERRFACVQTYAPDCAITQIPRTQNTQQEFNTKETDAEAQDELRSLVLAINRHHVENYTEDEKYPEIQLTDSYCSLFTNPTYLLVKRSGGEMFTQLTPQLLSDVLFFRSDTERVPHFFESVNADASTVPALYAQPYVTPYMCQDAGFEYARIHTVHQMQPVVSEDKFGESMTNLPEAAELLKIEAALQEQGMQLDEKLLLRYTEKLQYLLDEYDEETIAEYVGEDRALLMSSVVRQIYNRSIALPELLLEIARRDMTALAAKPRAQVSPTDLETLIDRGYQSIVFMAFNHTFAPYAQPVLTLSASDNSISLGFQYSYVDTIRDEFSYDDALRAAAASSQRRYMFEGIPAQLEAF